MARFVILGFKNAGKTCYMAGVHNLMTYGLNGFLMLASDHDKGRFLENIWKGIRMGEFPDPTDLPDEYNFKLAHGFNYLCEFDWLDFSGGSIGNRDNPVYVRLQNDLSICDGLTLLVDGDRFNCTARDDEEYKEKVLENLAPEAEAVRMLSEVIVQRSINGDPLTSIAVVVSKADLVPMNVSNTLIEEILKEKLNVFFAPGGGQLTCVILMTLGEGVDKGGKIAPKNIEQPIAYMALNTFLIEKLKLEDPNNPLPQDLRKEYSARAEKAGIHTLNLINAFPQSKMMYVNGVKTSLHEFYAERLKRQD